MHLNVLTQCSPSPTFEFMWRDPDDRTGTGYRSLRYWTDLAKRLEAACVDALFFADVHGIYDVYRRSWAPALRHAVQVPAIDPLLVVPAAAAATSRLGFAVTYSTTYHPPEQCARVFSSLDHLTNGRIAWNVVTSYLESAAKNGLGEFLEHDARYDRADEYMGVVEGLWERTFEPSPQRTPVVYQAGASPRGLAFAARHAEVVFLTLTGPKRGGEQVAELRRLAEEQGRDPAAVKALQGILVTVGQTEAEAERKAKLYTSLTSPESVLTKWCGWMGVDLAAYPEETRLTDVPNEAARRSALAAAAEAVESATYELAKVLTQEQGKPLRESLAEVGTCATWLRYFAELELPREIVQDDEHALVEVVRRPLGVVAAITPWNFPLALAFWKIAPALRAGNTVVLKPSPFTPLTTLRLAELLRPLLPAGVLNVVSGGDELGEWMSAHPVPRKISFTGSIATRKHVPAPAATDPQRVPPHAGGNH